MEYLGAEILVVLGVGALVAAALPFVAGLRAVIRGRRVVEEAWQRVQVELHARHLIIDDLLAVVSPHVGGDRDRLHQCAEARADAGLPGADPVQQAHAEVSLDRALIGVQQLIDRRPGLSADPAVVDLRLRLDRTRSRLANRRREYEAALRDYDAARATPVGRLAALVAGARSQPPYDPEAVAASRRP